jgi:hypothetical protein
MLQEDEADNDSQDAESVRCPLRQALGIDHVSLSRIGVALKPRICDRVAALRKAVNVV